MFEFGHYEHMARCWVVFVTAAVIHSNFMSVPMRQYKQLSGYLYLLLSFLLLIYMKMLPVTIRDYGKPTGMHVCLVNFMLLNLCLVIWM